MNEPEIAIQAEDLHSTILLPRSPLVPCSSNCKAPSDHTLEKLSTEFFNLNSMLTKQQDSKSEKKDEFESLEIFSQTFILNAQTKSIRSPDQVPSPTLLDSLRRSSTAKARFSFNNDLERKGCKSGTCLTIATLALLGDQASESEEAGKTPFMRLGSNQRGGSHSPKSKEQLRARCQKVLGKELSKDNMESLISCDFSAIEGRPEKIRFSTLLTPFKNLGPDAAHALKFDGEARQELKHNDHYFKSVLEKNKLFSCRLAHVLDQHFQQFLTKFLDVDSIADVDPSFFSTPCVAQSATHLRLSCDSPRSFSGVSSSRHLVPRLWSLAGALLMISNAWNGCCRRVPSQVTLFHLKQRRMPLFSVVLSNSTGGGIRKGAALPRTGTRTVVAPQLRKSSATSGRGRSGRFDSQGNPFMGRPRLHLSLMSHLKLFLKICHALLEVNLFLC